MKKCNNKGFTLVELLVAIAILAIIVGPLLHGFVTATKVNSKAKKQLEENTVAQNVMEELKAAKISDYVSANNFVYDTTLKKYIITYPNQDVNGHLYDARILLDANAYKKQNVTDVDMYNDQAVANISDMDILRDAFYVQNADQDRTCAGEIATKRNAGTWSNYIDVMNRTVTIDISSVGSGADNVTNVKVTYQYSYSTTTVTTSSKVYDNADTDGQLRAIYLFYTPLYASKQGAVKDNIVINNDKEVPVTVYLVKQETGDSTQAANELLYRVGVNVKEDADGSSGSSWKEVGSTTSFLATTQIRTNIGYPLSANASTAEISAIANQPVLRYDRAAAVETDTAKVKSILRYNTINGPATKDRIYDATVEVYKVASNPADKYAQDQLLLTFSGSKED
ncbi:MAG: type II secretion system protein [Lachnospiraceae bacterium]|nr:type II secretion system protein [Lachnospiraceae bacterium]